MMRLEVTSKHKDLLGDARTCEFGDDGGTIGRALNNDWILPDTNRYVSSQHATIDCNKGSYYLIDTSTNGIYINDSEKPLGRTNPQRLFNGDRLRMGNYRMTVHIFKGESLITTLGKKKPILTPEQLSQLVPEETLKSAIELLAKEEVSGDKEFEDALFGTAKNEFPLSSEIPAAVSNPLLSKTTRKESREQAKLLAAFATGLGLKKESLEGKVKPEEVMRKAGELLREFTNGAIELLDDRTALQGLFRLDQTAIIPQHKNPLKISDDVDDIMERLLTGQDKDQVDATSAVREVTDDLKSHSGAILAAMQSAFNDHMDNFDPNELEKYFDHSLNRGAILASINKFKYWPLYRDFFLIISRHNNGQFPQTFSDNFVRAYEQYIAGKRPVGLKNGKAA